MHPTIQIVPLLFFFDFMTFSLFKGYFKFRFSTKSPDIRLIQISSALLNRKSLKKKKENLCGISK